MALKPEISVAAALAVATMTYAIYQNATPTVADIRSLPEGNSDIAKSEKAAGWLAAGLGSMVSLIARDPVIFWATGVSVIGMSWWTRHANMVKPEISRFIPGGNAESEPMPEMTQETYTAFESQFAASEFAS
jgi:hypothetical protein